MSYQGVGSFKIHFLRNGMKALCGVVPYCHSDNLDEVDCKKCLLRLMNNK